MKTLDKMLKILGLKLRWKVEKIREIYKIDNIEVVLDSYPGLPTYFEIEANSELVLNNFCNTLDIDISKHVTTEIYDTLYGLDPTREKSNNLSFKSAKSIFENIITKNIDIFYSTLKKQKKIIKKIKQKDVFI